MPALNIGSKKKINEEETARIQNAALRRVFQLPFGIQDLVDAGTLGTSTVTDDGNGVTFSIGDGLVLEIRPFAETVKLSCASNKMAPLEVALGDDGDFNKRQILELIGFASLALRDGIDQTPTDWIERLNGTKKQEATA